MSSSGKKPLIIAHRGASAFAPENTLAAFGRAIDDGADGVECDVRLARDDVPVVFHDSTLQRLAKNKTRTSDFTSAELQNLDVGAWFNRKNPKIADPKFAGESVPTLRRLFDFLSGYGGRIYVELKGRIEEMFALVEAVAKLIRRTDFLPNIVLKSFKLEAIARARLLLPELRTAALFAPKILAVLRKKSRLIERARAFFADELSLHYSLATRRFARKAACANLPLTIWTTDRPAWIRRASEIGVGAIITNNPARLLAARAKIYAKN